MKARKVRELQSVLLKKGFEEIPNKKRHQFFLLKVNGKKTSIQTMFSHGQKEYHRGLMNQVKKQLKFKSTELAEDFFDCPMSYQEYVEMLKELNHI